MYLLGKLPGQYTMRYCRSIYATYVLLDLPMIRSSTLELDIEIQQDELCIHTILIYYGLISINAPN